MNTQVETIVKFEIEDGILYGPYPEGIELELDLVKRVVAERIEFLQGKEVPALVDTTGIKSASKEVRDYLSSDEASIGLKAAAILSRSMFSTFLANFFIKISLIKSPIPIRLFNTENEAKQWLEQFK